MLLALLLVGAPAAPQSTDRAAARTAIDRGDFDSAARIIEGALARYGTRASEDVWALRVMRGEVFAGRGRWAEASQALAFELPPPLRASETAVQHMVLRAFALNRTQKVDDARKLLDEAKTLAAARHPALLADVHFALARVAPEEDRERHAREAVRIARRHGRKVIEAKALASVAYELARKDRFGESIAFGEQALAIVRRIGPAKTAMQTEGNLGWSYLEIGDFETAEAMFTRADAAAVRLGATSERVPWLIQLGNIRSEKRDWPGAKRVTEQAIVLARKTGHRDLAYAIANLARIALATGNPAEARRLNNEALQHRGDDREGQLRSQILEAEVLIAEGKHDAAQKLLLAVIGEKPPPMTRAEAAGRLAQVYVRTHRPQLAEEQFQTAIAEARKARSDVKTTDLRLSLAHTTAEIFGEYVDFLAQSKRIEDALRVTEERRAQTLEEGLVAPAKLDARNVARQNDATILCYSLGHDRSYLWVVTKSDVVLHQLPPEAAIEQLAEAYRRDLLSADRGSMQWSGARGEALYEMLVRPAAIPRNARVIVVADGRLHALNFETLVVPSPRRYWIEDVVVMNASSLQLLARTPRKASDAPSLLLVGNTPSPDPAFPALAHAAREMRQIEKRFPRRTVLEGAKATPAAYEAASPEKFEYVHFVAHGEAIRMRPLDSAVILAPDASARYKLLARDVISRPRLTARLVTISSCEGAGTRTYEGEGMVGLAWAFLRAGADQVVAALWKVSDATTPQLMDGMYAGIRAGKDPAVALREAKLQFVRGTGPHRRPQYWAPFVLYAGT